MILKNLYDSHVHLLMTGEILQQVSLEEILSLENLHQKLLSSGASRQEWIVGFGWDENHFPSGFELNRKTLDQMFPERPVFLVRVDGHSSCVNSRVFQLLGWDLSNPPEALRSFIELDNDQKVTGILRESAHMKIYEKLPLFSYEKIKYMLLSAFDHFNSQGFTHLRDMTTRELQWEATLDLQRQKKLKSFVEHNFICEDIHDLDRCLQEIKRARTNENLQMKVRGVKFFYDGSLGSQTAALSQNYVGESNSGMTLWSEKEVKELFRRAWGETNDVSVHAIGDRASHDIVTWARQVYSEGFTGRLNLEHVQVLRPETIQMMKSLHITCHIQPCHWLSDQVWLKERLGTLYPHSFPWEALRRSGVPFQFGSDSPIEKSSLEQNLKALKQSAKCGIKKLTVDPLIFHVYNGEAPEGQTEIHLNPEGEVEIQRVCFQNEVIHQRS